MLERSGASPTPLACHFRYWILPSLVVATLMAMYFTGIPSLQSIVAPHINRELGVLESIQHLLLLALVVLNVRTALRQSEVTGRVLWWVFSTGALFMLLEELDYGQHYLEYLREVPLEHRSTVRSLHDGANTQRFKLLSDIMDIAFFILLPLAARRSDDARVRYITPSIYSIGTVAASFVLSRTGHLLDDYGFGAGGALYSGLAEFREVFTYWLWSQYFHELRHRTIPFVRSGGATERARPL
ncbi:MAG TPA: hypothetical protein VEB21_07505 [Terriglobales bacterium]|nr:hypothetical protein [Terriglobales bacterium]